MLHEPCRVYRVYGTPLLTGGFWCAPVKRVYSVQRFLDGAEDGEKPVLVLCFDFTAQAQVVLDGFIIKRFVLVYSYIL